MCILWLMYLIYGGIMLNWKTTLGGILSAAASYAVIDYTLQNAPTTYKLAQWFLAGGLAILGVYAKDSK